MFANKSASLGLWRSDTRFGGEVDIRGRRGTLADSTLARGGPTLANLGLCSLCPDMPRHCPGEGTGLLPVCSPHPLGRATAARPHGAWRARLPARSPPRRLEQVDGGCGLWHHSSHPRVGVLHAHSLGRASRPPASRNIAASMPSTCASPTTATTLVPSAPRSERAMYASRSAMSASYSGGT